MNVSTWHSSIILFMTLSRLASASSGVSPDTMKVPCQSLLPGS